MVEARVEFDYDGENDDELTLRVGNIITNVIMKDGGWWEGCLKGKQGLFPDNFVKVIARDHEVLFEAKEVIRREKKRLCRVVYSYSPVNEDELELEVDKIIEIIEEVEEGWWKGVLDDHIGVFPSNFVEEITDNYNPSKVKRKSIDNTHEKPKGYETSNNDPKKPKPLRVIGHGNILQDGQVRLKETEESSPDKKMAPVSKNPLAIEPATSDAPILPPKPVKEQARVLFSYHACNDDELTIKEGDVISIIRKEVLDQGWWKGELQGKIGVFPDNFVELITTPEIKLKKPERPDKVPALFNKINPSNLPEPAYRTAELSPQSQRSRFHKGKKDEKPELPDKPTPPGKKPHLPPPLKKPHRPSAPTSPVASVDSQIDERKIASHNNILDNQDAQESAFDGIESTSDKLTHLTATRARNPHRRPPSHLFLKDAELINVSNEMPIKPGRVMAGKDNDKESEINILNIQNIKIPSVPVNDDSILPFKIALETDDKSVFQMPVYQQTSSTTTMGDITRTDSSTQGSLEDNFLCERQREMLLQRQNSVSRAAYQELSDQVLSLQQTLENMTKQYNNTLSSLVHQLDEEKKIRSMMQLELDRLKKIVNEH